MPREPEYSLYRRGILIVRNNPPTVDSMNPVATLIDTYKSAGLKQQRRYRTVGATSMAVAATAGIGSIATKPDSLWYKTINKPSFQPPAWLFPLVWTGLYIDIAYVVGQSLADIEEREGRSTRFDTLKNSLAANLALNAGWSALFFRSKAPLIATAESAALAASTIDLVNKSRAVDEGRGNVLVPYAAWTSFALVLTGSIWWLNR